MARQLEMQEELYLDAEVVTPLNQVFEPQGVGFRVVRTNGELMVPGPLPCPGGCGDDLLGPGPCACGWTRSSRSVSIAQGLLGHVVEFRAPDTSLPPMLDLAADMAAREAHLRYELQSTLEELISKYEELTVVYESAETIVSITDLEGVGQNILDQAADILDVDHASLMLLEDEHLVIKAARGTRTDLVGRAKAPLGEEISSWVAREGKPVLVEDLATDPIFGRLSAREDQVRSLLSVPLKIKDRVLGVLDVNRKGRGGACKYGAVNVVTALASLAAISIENARTYQNAITDRLTSLYNYGYFSEQLTKAIQEAKEDGRPLCLLMFDIDHFKNFNDVNGHELGNVALVGVASLCMMNSRQKGDRVPDLVARYGGEEFMILLTGQTKEKAARTADRIRQRIEQTQFDGGQNQPMGKVTISIGVACYPVDAENADDLINQADQALYRAKRAGRNNVQTA